MSPDPAALVSLPAARLRADIQNAVSTTQISGSGILDAVETAALHCRDLVVPVSRAVSYAIAHFCGRFSAVHRNSQMLHSYTIAFADMIRPIFLKAADLICEGGTDADGIEVIAALAQADGQLAALYQAMDPNH